MRITVTYRIDIAGKITEKTAEADTDGTLEIEGCARALFESMQPRQWVINGPDGEPATVATAKEATESPKDPLWPVDEMGFRDWRKINQCRGSASDIWHAALRWERERNRKASA